MFLCPWQDLNFIKSFVRKHGVLSSLQEQYEFLHHALVHTLTLARAQIPADTYPQYMVTTSAAEFAQQFKASPNFLFFCTLG